MNNRFLPLQKPTSPTRSRFTFLATLLLAALFFMAPNKGWGQTTIFSENMGTPTGTTTIASYITGTAPATFQNKGTLTYSDGGQTNPGDVRTSSVSTTYTGASGNGNVFLTTTTNAYGFSIESIDASAYTSLSLNFGYRKESASLHATFAVDYWNGSAWVSVANTSANLFNESASATAGWYLSKSLTLPVGAQISGLKIRFVKTGTASIRVDDVKLTGNLTVTDYFWNGNGGSALSANFNTGPWSLSSGTAAALTWPASGTTNVANFANAQGGTVTMPTTFNSTPSNVILSSTGYTFATAASTPSTLSSTLNLNGNALTLSPNATAATLTLSGIISGTGGSLTNNTGTSTLGNANTFTGGVTLTSGNLNINNASALGTTAGTFAINGGTIDNTSGSSITTSNYPQTWGGNFAFTGSNALNLGTGAVSMSAARQVTVNGSTLTVGGIISGNTFGLTKAGSGSLALGGVNTFNGGVSINGGTLQMITGTNRLASSNAVTLANTAGVIFDLNGFSQTIGSIAGGGTTGGNVTLGSATLNTGGDNSSTSFDGVISGTSGILTKSGSGAFTLSNSNTFTGGTTLNAGTLNINNASALGTIAGTFAINGGTIDNTSGSSITTSNYPQSWGGNFAFTGTNALNLGTGAVAMTAARQVTVNASTLTVGGIISGNSFGLTKAGNGILTLSGTNTFTGGTTLSAGTLNINNASALGTVAGTFIINGGTIDNTSGSSVTTVNYPQTWGGDFAFTGTSDLNLGTGAVSMNASRQVTVSAGTLTVGGIISGSTFKLTKAGNGILALQGINTYSGGTDINAGTVTVNGSSRLGAAAGTLTINNGTLKLTTSSIGSDRSFVFGNANSTFDISSGITYTNYSASGTSLFSGSGRVNKTGLGTLTFSASNSTSHTYSGGLSITGGAVTINKERDLGAVPGAATPNNVVINGGSLQIATTLSADANRGFGLGTSNGTINVAASQTLTINGIVADNGGAGNLIKLGTGTLSLINSANTYSGTTTVTAGELNLNPSANATFASQIILNGGTLSTTGITTSTTFTSSSTLNLNASSTLALGSNAHTITFANSSAVTWAVTTLTITGWSGTAGSSGTAGIIMVGSGGLTSGQLAKINFSGYVNGAMIVSGELVPATTPSISTSGTLAALSTTYGTASSTTSFTVSGGNLVAGITITPPVGYEVSTVANFSSNVGNNSSPITVGSAPTVSSTTIYVRLLATASVGSSPYSGNIGLSDGVTSNNISTASSTVSTATLTISGLSTSSTVYNGTTVPSVTVGALAFVGLQNGDAATVTGSPTYAYATATVGTAKAITQTGSYGASFTSGVIGNYTITQPTLTADITAVDITITASAQSKNFGATSTTSGSSAFTITSGALVGSDNISTVTLAYSGSPAGNLATATAGAYTITPSAPVFSVGASSNYNIGFATGTLTINAIAADAPTSIVITPSNVQLSVAFVAPASNGGSTITSYKYSTDGGTTFLTRQTGTTASPIVITTLSTDGTTPLTNGVAYNVQIKAVTGFGDGTATANTSGTPQIPTTSTDYFRSNVTTGNWETAGSWQSSPDNTNWVTSTLVPDNNANTITIRNGNTITIAASVTVDQVVVNNGGILTVSAAMTVNNGTSDDITIENGGRVNYTVSTITYNASSTIRNKTNGIISIEAIGLTANASGVNASTHVYEDGAILQYNLTTTPSASGVTYFPNVTTEIPILRFMQTIGLNIGGGSATIINGRLELASGVSIAWAGNSTKTFRNGIVGLGGTQTMTLGSGTGAWSISGSTANLGTNGGSSLTLTNTNGINISNTTTATLLGNLNIGTSTNLTVAESGGSLDASTYQLIAGGASTTFTINGILKTANTNGFSGSTSTTISTSNTPTITLGAASTIEYNSAIAQNVSPRAYANLLISGAGMKSVPAGNNQITYSASLTTGNNLTLKSDATGTASIGNSAGTISGNVTVECYIAGRRAFRFLTPSVTTTTSIRANWQNGGAATAGIGTQITGSTTGANGFDATATGNASLHTYNAQATGTTTGFVAAANTDTETLKAGVGYRLLLRGDRNVNLAAASTADMNTATTLSATGTLKTGTVTFDSSASSPAPVNNVAGNTQTNGYTLIGNPYASPVDWHAVTKSGVKNNAYYTWDPTLGTTAQRGRYVVYSADTQITNLYDDNSGLSQTNRRYLQTGQAVFIKNNDLSVPATLTFNESNKATTSAYVFRSSNEAVTTAGNSSLYLRMYEPNVLALGGAPIDGALALFGTEYSTALDANDVNKLTSSGENLAFVRAATNLAIETLAPVVADDVLFVKTLQLQANKNYTFQVNTANFDTAVTAKMVDLYLNTETAIDLTQPSFVTFATTADANSYGADRFKIVFNNAALGNGSFNARAVTIYPNPIVNNEFTIALPNSVSGNVTVTMSNMLGQEVYRRTAEATTTLQIQPKQQLEEGVYVVSISNNGEVVQAKVIVKK